MDEKSCSLNPIHIKKQQIEYRLNLEFFEAEIQAQLWLNHQGIHANDKVVDYNNISALITDLLAMGAITVRVSDR